MNRGNIYTLLFQRGEYHLYPELNLKTGEMTPFGLILKRDEKNGGLFFWRTDPVGCVLYINTNTKVAVVNTRQCEGDETLFQIAKEYGAIKVELYDYNFDAVFFLEHGKTRYEVLYGFEPEAYYKEDYIRVKEEWETTRCMFENVPKDKELASKVQQYYRFDFRETSWEKMLE